MFWLANVINGSYSQEEVRRIEKWARQERAEAVHGLFSHVGRGVVRALKATGRGAKAVYTGVERWNRKQAAIRELSVLSDRTLKDIGLHREEIASVVEEMLSGGQKTRVSARSESVQHVREQAEAVSSIGEQETANQWQRAA